MSDEEHQQTDERDWWVVAVRVAGGLITLLGLPAVFAMFAGFRFVRTMEWSDPSDLFTAAAFLVAYPMFLFAGIGLVTQRPWSRFILLISTIITFVFGVWSEVAIESQDLLWAIGFLGLPMLVALLFVTRDAVRRTVGAEDETPGEFAKWLGLASGLIAFLMVLLGLIAYEIPQIGADMRMAGYERKCEASGDEEACGRVAWDKLQNGEPDEWRAGLDGLEAICKKHRNPMGCRRWAYAHSIDTKWIFEDNYPRVIEKMRQGAGDACREGDVRGCFIEKQTRKMGGPEVSTDEKAAHDEAAAKACDRGDEWGCHSLNWEEKADLQRNLCRAGFSAPCALLVDAEKGDAVDDVLPTCDRFPDTPACAFLADVTDGEVRANLARAYCESGGLVACDKAAAAVVDDDPHHDVKMAVYEAMYAGTQGKKRLAYDLGFWSLDPPEHPGLAEACEAGVAAACFGYGLEVTQGQRNKLVPDLDDAMVARYADTFGRACDLGFNAGCLAFAERLRNRPISEVPDVGRANNVLEKACSRGVRQACWVDDVDDDLRRRKYDRFGEMVEAACKAQPGIDGDDAPCRELAFYWAWEMKLTPWLFSERLSDALVTPLCADDKDKYACAGKGGMHPEKDQGVLTSTMSPWHVEDFTAKRRACQKRNITVCQELPQWVDTYHPGVDSTVVVDLSKRLCKAFPGAMNCD